MKQRLQRVLTVAMAAGLAVASAAQAQPVVQFAESTVVVSGVTAGSQVALLGASRGVRGTIPFTRRDGEVLRDDDGDGTVRLELPEGLSLRSLWVAVDLTTGEVGAACADGEEVAWVAGPRDGSREPAADTSLAVEDGRRYLEVLVARPGARAGEGPAAEPAVWIGSFGDGSGRDGDGVRDRRVRAALSDLAALDRASAEAPPERLAVGDVVVAVDPDTLEVWTRRLGEPGGVR